MSRRDRRRALHAPKLVDGRFIDTATACGSRTVRLAGPGERVTCPRCRFVLAGLSEVLDPEGSSAGGPSSH